MAYTNLTTFVAALASHGKNFQSYLDGVPGKTLQQGAYTDFASLCSLIGGDSGNSYTNLLAFLYKLAYAGNNIQEELAHTSQAERTAAAADLVTFLSDFATTEAQQELTAGTYTALTTAFSRMMTGPNSLGAWSERLTTAQITACNVAIAAMAVQAASVDTGTGSYGYP